MFFPALLGVKVALNIPYHNIYVQGYLFYVAVLFATVQCGVIVAYAAFARSRFKRLLDRLVGFSLLLTLLMIMELSVAIALRAVRGHVHFPFSISHLIDTGFFLFSPRWQPHLGTVVKPAPDFSQRLGPARVLTTHTRNGTRTVVGAPDKADKRIALIGGSTTYDIWMDDKDTWASNLQALLGNRVEVVNYGVPGYTTVENIWQTAFYVPEQNFACAVYFVGGNDLRMENFDAVDPDFESFHLRDQVLGADLESQFGMPAKPRLAIELMAKELWAVPFPPALRPANRGKVSSDSDARVERLYRRNLKTIVAINKVHGVKTIFIPAFLNRAQVASSKWIQYVAPNAAPALLDRLNEIMIEVGRDEGVDVLTGPAKLEWQDGDFFDWSHLNATGSRKFANAIAGDIRRLCVN